LIAELGTFDAVAKPLRADTALERDLGLDSLARAELFARTERLFGVRLSESALAEIETIDDLCTHLDKARSVSGLEQTLSTPIYSGSGEVSDRPPPKDMGIPVDWQDPSGNPGGADLIMLIVPRSIC